MIRASISPAGPAFSARLAAKARALAEAHAEGARRTDPWRWRAARLLWPLMGER